MSNDMSLGTAIGVDAGIAYALVALAVFALPETRGRDLAGDLPSHHDNAGIHAASRR
jgi:hypothetical protein